jgi:outer membrane lipoprotein-sorting protein
MKQEYLVKNKIQIAVIALLVLIVLYVVFFAGGYDSRVTGLIEKNVATKGGADAWEKVKSLRLSGRMSLGQGVVAPYTIEQKRPLKMCTEYEFNKRRVVQCVDGNSGWQYVPYLGRNRPEKLSKEQALGIADTASIDGMLLNADERGFAIKWLGKEDVNGQPTDKLEIKMPGGTVRWLYLDEATGLEVKLEFKRMLGKKEQMVETVYSDWKQEGSLWFPGKTVTRAKGASESNFVTIDNIVINPVIEDKRFAMPVFTSPNE